MYNSTERNKVRMVGILPSDGMDDIPVDIKAVNADIGVFPGSAMDSLRTYSRIPEAGTQVMKIAGFRDATVTVYTVPVDTLFYLTSAVYSHRNVSGSSGNSYFYLLNDSAVIVYQFGTLDTKDDVSMVTPYTFNPPMEIPAGWYFTGYSQRVNLWVHIGLHGFTMVV